MRTQKMNKLIEDILDMAEGEDAYVFIGGIASALKIILDSLPEDLKLSHTTTVFQLLAVEDVNVMADKLRLMESREDSTSLQ